jgi:hypothetical protein
MRFLKAFTVMAMAATLAQALAACGGNAGSSASPSAGGTGARASSLQKVGVTRLDPHDALWFIVQWRRRRICIRCVR